MGVAVITESKGLKSYIINSKSHCRVAEGVSGKENPQLARLRATGLRIAFWNRQYVRKAQCPVLVTENIQTARQVGGLK